MDFNFQFPLLGFLLCILPTLCKNTLRGIPLSIPFIGIFALHRDFVSATSTKLFNFQFPLLGFLLCIPYVQALIVVAAVHVFQFPLLGFLLCITLCFSNQMGDAIELSIPFIGIFALHPKYRGNVKLAESIHFQFPLLGFLLCIRWHFLAGLPF